MSRPRVSRLLSLVLCVLLPGCAAKKVTAPPTGFEHAVVTAACSPTDGPAIAIYLAGSPIDSLEPAPPYIRLGIWQAEDQILAQDWPVTGAGAAAEAWYYKSASAPEAATAGAIHITDINVDSSVDGSVNLTFPTAGAVSGTYKATWLSRQVACQ